MEERFAIGGVGRVGGECDASDATGLDDRVDEPELDDVHEYWEEAHCATDQNWELVGSQTTPVPGQRDDAYVQDNLGGVAVTQPAEHPCANI